MSSHKTSFRLPDTLRNWPWSRNVNPHYAQVSAASAAWLESFKVFRPKAQSAFNKCNFGLLASLAYPLATQGQLRAGCDLMNLFFVFDELSDVGDEKTVQELADIIMDALRNPGKTRPHGESVVGVIAQQFWQHAVKIASVSSQRRFIATFDDYCQSVVEQATDRAIGRVHDVDSYLHMRRENIGAKPSFAILELGMDLPDDVFYHPTLVNLSTWAIDMLILGNDICSYNVEQARGDDSHNIVTVVMRQYNTDIQGAMDWIARYHDHLVAQFIDHCGKLPSWGPEIDAQLRRYLDGLGNWVRANDCWSFESQRYFGKEGLKVMASRSVTLLPKVNAQKVETTPKVERHRAFSTSRPMPSMH